MNWSKFHDKNLFKLGVIGTLTGVVASFIGGGAEILIVPLLVYFGVLADYKTAIGTSLASLLLPIGIFAVYFYMNQKCKGHSCVNWPYALLIGLFFTIGTLASYYTSKMNTTILKKIFAVVIIIIGTLILLNKDENQQTE